MNHPVYVQELRRARGRSPIGGKAVEEERITINCLGYPSIGILQRLIKIENR
jgi:hypothetical protein